MPRRTTGRVGDSSAVYACDGACCIETAATKDGAVPAGWLAWPSSRITYGPQGGFRKTVALCPRHARKHLRRQRQNTR